MKVTLRKLLLNQQKFLTNMVAEIADVSTTDDLDPGSIKELNVELKSIQRELNFISDIIKLCNDRKYY